MCMSELSRFTETFHHDKIRGKMCILLTRTSVQCGDPTPPQDLNSSPLIKNHHNTRTCGIIRRNDTKTRI